VNSWPAERERRIESASGRLANELHEARLLADTLASRAIRLTGLPREDGFTAADRLVPIRGLEAGVAIYDSGGAPYIWGGRFRLPPLPQGDSLDVRLTPYYAVLEVRRHAPGGRIAVGAVLLGAEPAVPDQERGLAARFRERTEVGLSITAPQAAPDSPDVFDYEQPTTRGTRVLFSAQFVPPEQGEAIARARGEGSRYVAWALLAALVLAVWLVPAGAGRVALALLPLGLALRSPLGLLLGIPAPFDPTVFRSEALGPVSSAAGPLALVGIVIVLIGALLWERAPVRRWPPVVVAILLLAGAPYLMAELGRGIIPPSSGVSIGLWLAWHLTLFLISAGLISLAAALLRGREPSESTWWAPGVGAAIALTAAAIGTAVWNARYGWPDWYTVLWLPALVLVTRPASRRATIIGIAVVAGSAAALLAWGAEIEGRLEAARADMVALGEAPDPSAEATLRAFGRSVLSRPAPRSTPELYALWRSSSLFQAGRRGVLGVWRPDGTPVVELALDQLDMPRDSVAARVRAMVATDSSLISAEYREPATSYLLLVRRDEHTVVSAVLGPKSALVPPSRLGRLLASEPAHSPLYRLTLAPSPSVALPSRDMALWRREGWVARGERTALIAGGPRDITGSVQLGSPASLAVRGALVIALDVAVLALLWSFAAILGGHAPRRPTWMPELRSYEARLGAALAVFYLTPTVLFAAWGVSRLGAEVASSRDRMIEQTLRDIVPPGVALPALSDVDGALGSLAERVDADLALYRDGEHIAGSSGGLLEALGVLPPLMDPEAYHAIEIHGGEVASTRGPSGAVATRVGYRAVRLADYGGGVLALPQTAADPMLGSRQLDLAMLLLLASLAGVGGSLLAARVSAKALSRPVAELRDAALAFGRGEPVPPLPQQPSAEFAPVFAAFDKMTADVRRAREAQERVARIVAWGEMANQVAHEIKNPLTPMRLGVQHLRRVHQDGRTPIGPVLEDTTKRILSEIDRLDRIARSFSRFGVPASERGPMESVKLPSVVRDVADLYRLGPEGAEIVVETLAPVPVAARVDEVKEALVNLLENARNAQARRIRIVIDGTTLAVYDDGCGIPPALLPMIFEPRFSTSTSGSGLGLPIVKRLVEGWGGKVEVSSTEGGGTVVRLHLVPAASGEGGPVSAR
jgi:signal transduction histidine kinase